MKYVHKTQLELSEEECEDMSFASSTTTRVRWVAGFDGSLFVDDGPGVPIYAGEWVRMRRFGATAETALDALIKAIQAEGWAIR